MKTFLLEQAIISLFAYSDLVMLPQVNIIGAGRLGKSLAFALVNAGLIRLNGICNRDYESASLAVRQLNVGKAVSSIRELPFADITFITTTDAQIASLAKELATHNNITPHTLFVHCSGALNSQELTPLKDKGAHVASLYPLKAFTSVSLSETAFKECDCIIEGDKEAVLKLSSLFEALQAQIIFLKAEAKLNYHTAAVMAANYLVTLAAISMELMQETGLDTNDARRMIFRLMQSSLANIQEAKTPIAALTGPLVRGDLTTIRNHLQNLGNKPLIKSLYQAAAIASLSLISLNENEKASLYSLLAAQNLPDV